MAIHTFSVVLDHQAPELLRSMSCAGYRPWARSHYPCRTPGCMYGHTYVPGSRALTVSSSLRANPCPGRLTRDQVDSSTLYDTTDVCMAIHTFSVVLDHQAPELLRSMSCAGYRPWARSHHPDRTPGCMYVHTCVPRSGTVISPNSTCANPRPARHTSVRRGIAPLNDHLEVCMAIHT